MSGNFLIHIDKAKREIAAADSLVKVKDLWNKADAMRALGQAAKDPDLINSATEFKLRCERRLGEMILAMKERGEISEGRNSRTPTRVKIAEMDLSYDISSRAQRIASVPEDIFEAAIFTAREEEQQITHRAFISLIGEGPAFNHRAQGTGENEWYTPRQYIEAARKVLGEIDLDPASTESANEFIKAKRFFTRTDNGLAQPWGGRVWLNPPYTQPDISNFVVKLMAEIDGARVCAAILLTHNYTDTEWFHRAESKAALICFTKGRIAFLNELGEKAAPTQGQAFFYYGENGGCFNEVFKQFGFIR